MTNTTLTYDPDGGRIGWNGPRLRTGRPFAFSPVSEGVSQMEPPYRPCDVFDRTTTLADTGMADPRILDMYDEADIAHIIDDSDALFCLTIPYAILPQVAGCLPHRDLTDSTTLIRHVKARIVAVALAIGDGDADLATEVARGLLGGEIRIDQDAFAYGGAPDDARIPRVDDGDDSWVAPGTVLAVGDGEGVAVEDLAATTELSPSLGGVMVTGIAMSRCPGVRITTADGELVAAPGRMVVVRAGAFTAHVPLWEVHDGDVILTRNGWQVVQSSQPQRALGLATVYDVRAVVDATMAMGGIVCPVMW